MRERPGQHVRVRSEIDRYSLADALQIQHAGGEGLISDGYEYTTVDFCNCEGDGVLLW